MKPLVTFLAILLVRCIPAASNDVGRQTDNILTFAKLYGYIRYFHPSEEAAAIDWRKFAIYGVREVENARNANELTQLLLRLFQPIAPSIEVFNSHETVSFNLRKITPGDTSDMKVITWQHLGIEADLKRGYYKSIRLNRMNSNSIVPDTVLFQERARFGEYIREDIGQGLSCILPLALYGDDQATFPRAGAEANERLRAALDSIPDPVLGENDPLYERLASLVMLWNILHHSYPYFDVSKIDWTQAVAKAIAEAYQTKTDEDFVKLLRRLTAKLKDGHVAVKMVVDQSPKYLPPFSWEWIEDSLIITSVPDTSARLQVGDRVLRINDSTPEEFFRKAEQYTSASTPQHLKQRSLTESVLGEMNSVITLIVTHPNKGTRTIESHRTLSQFEYKDRTASSEKIKDLGDGLYYVNLTTTTMSEIEEVMPEIVNSKCVLFDMRGYPVDYPFLLQHLFSERDTSSRWAQAPQIIYPDQKNVTYKYSGWGVDPKAPFIKARRIFITNAEAVSYAESILNFVKHYHLGTIVGQPTAGTNGNLNYATFPGGYLVCWSGLKIVKHNGSRLQGVGILPDLYVERSIRGIREGRDELLEKAIELAKTQ